MANTIQIVITGQNKAGGALGDAAKGLSGLSGAAKSAGGILGGFGSALGGVATIAGGIVAANIFGKIASGVASFASTGLEAVGSSQQLQTSLKALLTQNNMYEKSVETVTQAITQQVMSQEELDTKSAELSAHLASQRAQYQEQQQQIIQLTAAWGENGLATIRARAAHDELALKIQKTEREIAGLTTTETTYNQVTRTSVNQVLDQAEAFKLASKQTQELMDFVSQVAVISPFETEDVEMTTKFAVAAGLGVEQTKAFVPAFLDLAGAVGITSSELGFAADQLFQVKKVGKLTEIDLRQLRRLGIDLAQVIGVEMGMSVDEFNAQAEKTPEIFDELFDAITRYSQNTFAGTSQEMAMSVKGLMSTLNDIFVIGSRDFWRPIVEAITPAASEILGRLSDILLGGDMMSLGQKVADILDNTIGRATKVIQAFQKFGFKGATRSLLRQLGFDTRQIFEIAGFFDEIVDTVKSKVERIKELFTIFQAGGLFGARFGSFGSEGLLAALGFSPETISVVERVVNSITESFGRIQALTEAFGVRGAAVGILEMLGLTPEQIKTAFAVAENIFALSGIGFISRAIEAFQEGGLQGVFDQIFTDITVTIPTAIINLATIIGNELSSAWVSIIQPQLFTWRDQFFDWVAELYPQIPAFLTELVENITTGLEDSWPTISETLSTWAEKFWEWTEDAVEGASAALAALTAALVAWATSSDGQEAASGLGEQIGKMIYDGIKQSGTNQENVAGAAGGIITSLASGLLFATAGLVGSFIAIGAEIVAGIITGILESMGIDLEPTTISELGAVLSGIGTNAGIIAKTVGTDIITGIREGITDKANEISTTLEGIWSNLKIILSASTTLVVNEITRKFQGFIDKMNEIFDISKFLKFGKAAVDGLVKGIKDNSEQVFKTLRSILQSAIDRIKSTLGISSPSKITTNIGQQIVQGLILGIKQESGQLELEFRKVAQVGVQAFNNMRKVINARMQQATGLFDEEFLSSTAAGAQRFTRRLEKELMRELRRVGASGQFKKENVFQAIADTMSENYNGAPNVREFFGEIGSEMFKQMETVLGPIMQQIGQEIAMKLVQGAGAFLSLGQTAAKRLITPLEENLKKIQDKIKATGEAKIGAFKILDEKGAVTTINKVIAEISKLEEKQALLIENGQKLKDTDQERLDALRKILSAGRAKAIETLGIATLNIGGEQKTVDEVVKRLEDLRALQKTQFDPERQKEIDFLHQRLKFENENNAQVRERLSLLFEQRQAQEDLKKAQEAQLKLQQQQADLQFLQQQLGLLQTIRDLGLDPAEILGGIKLGIDADLQAIVDAMAQTVEAIINQVDTTLQISSPSRVMMEKGQQIVAGLFRGITGGLRDNSIMRAIDSSLTAGMASVQSSSQRITNNTYNFNQTVNTRATQSSVIQDYRVMQNLIGA